MEQAIVYTLRYFAHDCAQAIPKTGPLPHIKVRLPAKVAIFGVSTETEVPT